MSSLPLFDSPKTISAAFDPNTDIVLYEGDTVAFIDTLPGEAVKLIITSPPYNLGKEYEDRVSIERYLDLQAETIEKLIRVLHPQGSICWQVGNFVDRGRSFRSTYTTTPSSSG